MTDWTPDDDIHAMEAQMAKEFEQRRLDAEKRERDMVEQRERDDAIQVQTLAELEREQ